MFIEFVLYCLTDVHADYVFFKGHPIDTRNKKFNLWRRMYSDNKFFCKSCGSKVVGMDLIKCKTSGHIYRRDGRIKHTFLLKGDRGQTMSIDHWIPKSFLRKHNLRWNIYDNLAIMCDSCNKFKADILPHNWQEQYNRMGDAGSI